MKGHLIQWLAPGDPPIVATETARAELAKRYPDHEIHLLTVFRVDCFGRSMDPTWDAAGVSPLWCFCVGLVTPTVIDPDPPAEPQETP